jgi:hypothetical protein
MPCARYLAHRQLAALGAAPLRVDRRMLEQQQRVGDLAGLAPVANALLEGDRLGVPNPPEMGHPELLLVRAIAHRTAFDATPSEG